MESLLETKIYRGRSLWPTEWKPTGTTLLIQSANLTSDYHREFMAEAASKSEAFEHRFKEPGEPTTKMVADISDSLRSDPDVIIAFGGGSTIDLAKAVAVVIADKKSILDYEFGLAPKANPIRVVAVPTMFGSGSEVTPYAVLNNSITGRKFTVVAPTLRPQAVLLDPGLGEGAAPSAVQSAAYDAMTHCLEAVLKPTDTSNVRRDAIAGLEIGFQLLAESGLNQGEPQLLGKLAELSLLGGSCIAKNRTGLIHTLSVALAPHFAASHGLLNRIITPHVLKYNAGSYGGDFASLMGESCNFQGQSDFAAVEFFETWLRGNYPVQAGKISISDGNRATIAARVLQDTGLQQQNHRAIGPNLIARLVASVLEDDAFAKPDT